MHSSTACHVNRIPIVFLVSKNEWGTHNFISDDLYLKYLLGLIIVFKCHNTYFTSSPFSRTLGPSGPRPYNERYPPEPYQPPPPGIKDSPTNGYGIQIMYYVYSCGFNIESETKVVIRYFYIGFYSNLMSWFTCFYFVKSYSPEVPPKQKERLFRLRLASPRVNDNTHYHFRYRCGYFF